MNDMRRCERHDDDSGAFGPQHTSRNALIFSLMVLGTGGASGEDASAPAGGAEAAGAVRHQDHHWREGAPATETISSGAAEGAAVSGREVATPDGGSEGRAFEVTPGSGAGPPVKASPRGLPAGPRA